MQTIKTDNENENSSAAVNLPHIPNDILLPSEHGLIMYWHIGNSKKAKATVAITKTKETNKKQQCLLVTIVFLLSTVILAVQIANNICIESKKKNMTNNEILAPNGRHNACIVSSVCTLFSVCTWKKMFISNSVFFSPAIALLCYLSTGIQETICTPIRPIPRLLFHIQTPKRPVNN